jgi:zinc transport system substrate-binding protein
LYITSMKKLYSHSLIIISMTLIILATALAVSSCRFSQKEKPVITVSIQPQKYLLEKIVGSKFNVICLLSEGSNPESYDPSMNNVMALEHSEAYFTIGNIGFEYAILGKVKNNNPNLKIYNNSTGIKPIKGDHSTAVNDTDPHVWTSVKNAKIIASNMLKALIEIDPHHKHYYTRNYNELKSDLDQLDDSITARLSTAKHKTFLIWHPSLSYFARDYGLTQLAFEKEGKEASAASLKKSVDLACGSGAKVFFYQAEFDGRQVNVLNNEIGCKIVEINPMSYDWAAELNKITDAICK